MFRVGPLLFVLYAPVLPACNVEPRCSKADLSPLKAEPSYAVVASDYRTTAIALMDSQFRCITESWIDSATTPASLTTTIGGDVVLPGEPVFSSTLGLIDRLGVDVLTLISLPQGNPIEQFRAHSPTEPTTGGFRSNPQDAISVSSSEIWVTRYEPNLDANATALERGNDIAVIDRATQTLVSTIDLSPFNQTIGSQVAYARPGRMVQIGDFVVVGLSRLSRTFMQAGQGAIVLLSKKTRKMRAVEFSSFENCGDEIAYSPAQEDEFWVLCSGKTFASNEERRKSAGILRIRIQHDLQEEPQTSILSSWAASDHPDTPVPRSGLIPLSDHHVLAVASGTVGIQRTSTPDQIVLIELVSNESQVVFTSKEAFSIGQGVMDRETQQVLVPDGIYGVHIFSFLENREIVYRSTQVVSACHQLPAREIRTLKKRPES